MTDALSVHSDALAVLAAVDAELARAVPALHSLDPARRRATPLAALGAKLLMPADSAPLGLAFAEALGRIVRSQLQHFPGNLFWDSDYLAASLVAGARAADEPALRLAKAADLGVALSARFGCASPIRFRYVHDFTYGFDWQRWVSADPRRAGVGPFDPSFLRRMLDRGDQLASRAAADDPTFPRLRDAAAFRNPFGFSREPEHEVRLHRALAERGQLPVQAWRSDATPDWRTPATRLRVELAAELAIPMSAA